MRVHWFEHGGRGRSAAGARQDADSLTSSRRIVTSTVTQPRRLRAGDLRGARGFHALSGDRAGTFAMSVSGNRRLTFRFEHGDEGDVLDVDFEDYH
jgi:proteic killer suppression protein